MKKRVHVVTALSVAISLCVGSAMAWADTTTTTTSTTTTTTTSTQTQDSAKLASSYATFAGSATNAQALVNGLHSGTAVVLVTPATATTPATQVSFTPATHQLGYGNVNIALALAQSELKAAGITQPTVAQLEAALNGGTIAGATGPKQLPGVLTLRSEDKGWGSISKTLGLKLGAVLADAKTHGPVPDKADMTHGDKSEMADKDGKADKADHDAKADKVAKADRPDKVDRADKPEKPERPDKPERGGR
ncbi:hypothetical protein [Dyella japonica]|uniref:Uncharacterized protein n=1 Tax=Dyella japonica A8 TaxID=1217721 RepID=A0A075K1H9_9GAMM|nr:hypothetical protein [Dyella japonica]AIF47670.1 hypothetical protein HY57_10545 [Dyella japonica A8]